MRKILFILFCLTPFLFVAQSKKLWLKQADDFFAKKDYASALQYYKKVLNDSVVFTETVKPYEIQLTNLKTKDYKDTSAVKKGEPSSGINKHHYVVHQMAVCYFKVHDYENEIIQLRKSVSLGSYPNDRYFYAKSLMNTKRYTEAINVYEDFMKDNPGKDSLLNRAQHEISGCYFALDSVNNMHKTIVVRKMDTVVFNKGTSSFAAVYWGSNQKLIFTSARHGGVLTNRNEQLPEESDYLCDLYWTEQKDDQWTKPHNFGRPLNSGFHDGAGAMDADEIMYFTRWHDGNRKESAIHMARGKDGHFFEAIKLDETINLPGYKSAHPFVTFDGSTMFFSANIPGGMGGMDIWYTKLDPDGLPGPVKNLGAPVNTAGDEVTPYYHTISGTLFFSSDGHSGLGGLDVFKSHYDPDEQTYSLPVNIGRPVNSERDDAYYILDRIQKKGYFSSDREPCVGGHCYDIYEFDNEEITIDLSGVVYDLETGDPIPNALVTMKDVHGEDDPLYLQTDDKGFYSTPLPIGKEYFMKAQKLRYLAAMANKTTVGITETTHLTQDFNLDKMPAGEIVIEGVEYDLGKYTLRQKSKEVLNKVYDLMMKNENIVIELNAHTDTRGSDVSNMKLSQGRAQSCVDYLISKGIATDRLVPKGYGETKPLINDAEIAKLKTKPEQEAAHQKNRRTAFTIIGETPMKIIVKEIDHSNDPK